MLAAVANEELLRRGKHLMSKKVVLSYFPTAPADAVAQSGLASKFMGKVMPQLSL
jgi:hypothetical protein